MNRTVAVILSLLAIICIGILGVKYRQERAMLAQSRQSEEAVRTQFNAALESIAEIQDSLNAIAPEQTPLRDIGPGSESNPQVTQTQKERMLETISNLRESIQLTGQRIRDLEANLKGSQAEVAGLRRVIDNLKRSVAQKETMIQDLTARVDSLGIVVAGLKQDVQHGQETILAQEQTIEEKRKEITTIHYVIGTKDQLKEQGVITDKGGFLGMGKSTQLTGSFGRGDFKALDTDESREIMFKGKEPRVLSSQSTSSYEIQIDGENRATLRILDPDEFRRAKYLVILVK